LGLLQGFICFLLYFMKGVQIQVYNMNKTLQVKDLEEKIEYHLKIWLNGASEERLNSEKEARRYALQYKELTGEWYRREWKD